MDLRDYLHKMYVRPVADFRLAAGLPMGSVGENINHALHLRLLSEEALEFITSESLADKADALADVIVIAAGYLLDAGAQCLVDPLSIMAGMEDAGAKLGINVLGAFTLVMDSNMSKVSDTEHQVHVTQGYYKQKYGLDTEVRIITMGNYDVYGVYSASDDAQFPRGKLLKPGHYRKPAWTQESIWKLPPSDPVPFTDEELATAVQGVEAACKQLDPLIGQPTPHGPKEKFVINHNDEGSTHD